jgi:hypothetical protein
MHSRSELARDCAYMLCGLAAPLLFSRCRSLLAVCNGQDSCAPPERLRASWSMLKCWLAKWVLQKETVTVHIAPTQAQAVSGMQFACNRMLGGHICQMQP